jgi:hypothetical protein
MHLRDRIVVLTLAAAGSAAGCAAPDGAPEDISALPDKQLTVQHDRVTGSGLGVTLDYFDPDSRCPTLRDDAFARLNGRSVPLSRGQVQVIPPKNDDGGVVCTHPSVTLGAIPADLSPPWTLEIGDPSQVVAATFGPGSPNPFTVGAPVNAELVASFVTLAVAIQRPPGVRTPAAVAATLTSSDGHTAVRAAELGESLLQFPNPFDPGWAPGPVTIRLDVYYFPPDVLLGCENAACSLASMPGACSPATGLPGGPPCSSVVGPAASPTFTLPLDCGGLAVCS